MKNLLYVLLISLVSAMGVSPAAFADPNYAELSKYKSPYIQGDKLIISGTIDSHIYDYLAREDKALKNVRVISVNSYGGNISWGLEVARKIRELGKETILESGNVCASACVPIFAAGTKRVMAKDTWMGIHGARLGAGYQTNFWGLCFIETEDGREFMDKLKGCKEFLSNWYEVTLKITNQMFDGMELSGVSPDLQTYYFALPDDPEWPKWDNILRKPDWVLKPDVALSYNLATELK